MTYETDPFFNPFLSHIDWTDELTFVCLRDFKHFWRTFEYPFSFSFTTVCIRKEGQKVVSWRTTVKRRVHAYIPKRHLHSFNNQLKLPQLIKAKVIA